MKIKVTQEHIDNGLRSDCYYCPIALALKDATGFNWYVGSIYIGNESTVITLLSNTTKDFIWRFDIAAMVIPFEFDIDIPSKFVRS